MSLIEILHEILSIAAGPGARKDLHDALDAVKATAATESTPAPDAPPEPGVQPS